MTSKRKSLTLLAAFLLLAGMLPAQSFRTLLNRANKAYEIHAYNVAINDYLGALQKRQDDVEALSKVADCYRHLNQMDEAKTYYARATRVKGVAKEAVFQYAQTLKSLGLYDEAKQWFLLYARDYEAATGNLFAQSCDFAKTQMSVNSAYTVTNEYINTSSSEFGPAFYGNQSVVFSSARTDIQRSGQFQGKINNQLFMATIGGRGYLESPVFLKSSAKNEFNEGPVSYSPDGQFVAYTKNNFVDGTRQIPSSGMELSIYLARVGPSGDWLDMQPFPFNGSDYSTGYPCFAPDGNSLYFASNRPDGFGGYDIYVSYKVGQSWSTPENLGPVVNSAGDEISPYYDGTSLFFSSDWHQGLGGFDVFRAESSGNRWVRIFHLGNGVNTPRDDYGFIYDSFRNLGYLVSNRLGGRGSEDIYRLNRSADNIVLRVTNASDGTPISGATVDFSACGENAYQTDANGVYTFQAVQGLNCRVTVTKDGYLSASFDLNSTGASQSREYSVALSKQGESYPGKIVNYTTRAPIEGVLVIATNRITGAQLQAQTDRNGDYFLALSPYSSYDLRFSSPGYKELNFSVDTESGLDRTILGVISMLPATAVPGVPDTGNPDIPSSPGQPDLQTGFAVQVAAISSPSLDQFADLASLGNVYYAEQAGRYKIRVGVYPTREEAENALRSAKAKGYPTSFIVKEEGGGPGVVSGPATTSKSPAATAGSGAYKVQLAAYSNPKNFDPSRISYLGPIEERKKGKLTVKYIGGFSTLDDAQRAVSVARAAGFDTAFVVVEENGVLKPVK